MTKITVHKFKNNKIGYSTGNMEISLNSEEPIEVKEMILEDNIAEEIMNNPKDYKFNWGKEEFKKEKEDKKEK